jgi:hypothetical protein
MNILKQFQRVRAGAMKFWKKHGSTVLTVGACVGVAVTGYLAAQAGAKAEQSARNATESGAELTTTDYIRVTCKDYIPPVISGATTIGCIISAHMIDKKQIASLAAAYAVLVQSFQKYRAKVQERYGDGADAEVRQEIAEETMVETKPAAPEDGKLLFFDEWSNRYYEKTMSEMLYAEYHFNRNYILRGYASLNEFYAFLDVPPVPEGDAVGWSFDNGVEMGYEWVDFHHTKNELDDGLEVYILSFPFSPAVIFAD